MKLALVLVAGAASLAIVAWVGGASERWVLSLAILGGSAGLALGLAIANGREARRTLGSIQGQLALVRADQASLRQQLSQATNAQTTLLRGYGEAQAKELRSLSEAQRAEVRREARDLSRTIETQMDLMQAFHELHRVVELPSPMPLAGGWAASEDLLLWLVGHILEDGPDLVLDIGSGQSTVWMAGAMRAAGSTGRVVAIEHNADYAWKTVQLGRSQGVLPWMEVIHAPLRQYQVSGRDVIWYDEQSVRGLEGIGLVCVDGPPGSTAPLARWPALPMLRDRLLPGCRIVMDDLMRADEKEIASQWAEGFPELKVEHLPFEKRAVAFTVPVTNASAPGQNT